MVVKRMPLLLIAVLAALALGSNATAKELASAQACGKNGCAVLEDRDVANTILSARGSVSPPPPTADFYVLSFIFEGGDPNLFLHYFVPSTGLIAGNKVVPGELMWFPVYDDALAGIRRSCGTWSRSSPRRSGRPSSSHPARRASRATGRRGSPEPGYCCSP
jgi:hypothetical protein